MSGTEGCKSEEPVRKVYDVYSREIDPKNMMPLNPNQLPHPDQKKPLPVERVVSSIPKGGTDGETWQYPSEQMFYNALKRKGKGDDVDEEMVSTIVSIHNNMNEKTWEQVLEWERLHASACKEEPKLVRFMGRPDDLTPRAWLANKVLGKDKPFDRHDWFVDRCGKEVRYVIDYYHDEKVSPLDKVPKNKKDRDAIKSIEVIARPAIEDVTSLFDRVRMPVMRKFNLVPPPPVYVVNQNNDNNNNNNSKPMECPVKHDKKTDEAKKTGNFEDLNREKLNEFSKNIQTRCKSAFEMLKTCDQESECQKASVSLFHCMATIVCPPEADRYKLDTLSTSKFDEMTDCVGRFEIKAAAVLASEKKQAQ